MAANNVKVVCRCRPHNEIEDRRGGKLAVRFFEQGASHVYEQIEVTLDPQGEFDTGFGEQHKFTFDCVFGPRSTQQEVFEYAGRAVVEDILQGFNGTIFAYGQTSSGKTHTMEGPDIDDEDHCGLIPRAVDAIFDAFASADETTEFIVSASYVEIYMERVRDLLDNSKHNLQIREDPIKGVYVQGMHEEFVGSADELIDVMRLGKQNRSTAATARQLFAEHLG